MWFTSMSHLLTNHGSQREQTPVEDDEPAAEPLEPGEEFLQFGTPDSDGKSGMMRWQTASGWKRYLWKERPEYLGVQTIQDSLTGRLDSPPDESTLAEQRQKSAEKRKRRAAVLEVLVFALFIAVVMATSYGERSPMAFYMTQNVGRQILETGDVGFFEIDDIPSFWTWITTGLMPALHVRSWYNGRVSPDAMLLEDMVTYPLGPVQLRQVRIEPGQHCAPPKQMLNVTSRCSVPYSLSVADTQNYTLRWVPHNTTGNGTGDTVCSPSSSQTSRELHNCANNVSPWRYTYASLTDGVPYFGQHGSYIGGGYIAWLGATDESMSFLQRQRWLDENSRAVFIEFILYNPHVNLFSVVSLVVEFTNLGAAYKSSEIVTVRLIQHDVILLLVLRGVLALFLLYFVFREGKSLMSRPLEYLCEFWSWVELLVITVGFSTLVIYFYTQNIIDEVAEQRRNGNSVFHLYKSAVSWFQISTYLQGFLICCATLKFIRLLRFNSHVYALSMTMKKSLKPLMSFMLSVAVILLAFIIMMVLTHGSNSNEYKNLSSSLQSLLLMMLGSFDFDALSSGHRILGPLIFFLYQVVMQFFLLTIFMVILFEVYENGDWTTNPYDIGFTAFLKETTAEAAEKIKGTSLKSNKPRRERSFSTDMIPKINRGISELFK
ncbi:polycystin-2-like [Branchiostoma floridae x Branchiostoma japonicum]